MRPYTRILVWENNRRLRELHKFSKDLVAYVGNSTHSWMAEGRTEQPAALEARINLNSRLDEVRDIVSAAGINVVMMWSPPPAVGGYVQQIDLFLNLFALDRFQIDFTVIRDMLVRAIAIYQRNHTPAVLRTINPLTYVGFFVEWLASLPFRLLGRAGFNAERAEQSWLGRLVKFIIEVVIVLSAVATVLEFIGWTDKVRSWLAPYTG